MSTTTTDLAVREDAAPAVHQAALAIRSGQTTFDDFQNAALNQLGLRNASNADRAVFLHQCQRTGLDPFAKQIYMIERQGKWTIQTGIDGWRVIRVRAEVREGVRAKLGRALFYDGDGNEFRVWVRAEAPAACSITLVIGDSEYTSTLMYREYVQLKDGKPMAQWASKPAHMLEKCTEADVYRKAFPQDFSGIYLDDAMPADGEPAPRRQRITADAIRARNPQTVTAEVVTPDVPPAGEQATPVPAEPSATPAGPAGGTPITEATWNLIGERLDALGVEEGNRARVARQVGGKPAKDLTEAEGRMVADTLEGMDAAGLDGFLAERKLQDDRRDGEGEVRDGE